MPRAGRHCSIALAAAAALAPAGASGFTIDTEQWFGPGIICLSARNLGLDAIAEYVDNDGRIVWRAGSWLGRDGRYLLRPPASDGLSIRFRALGDRPVEPQDVALEVCPDPMPADAVDALTAAINARLADYLGEHGGDEAALPDHFRQAIEALGDAGLSSWKAVAHFEYASYARATDRLAEASDHYRHALAGFADTGDLAGRAAASNSLGLAALRRGELEEAAGWFDRALPMYLELDDRHSVAAVNNNLGLLHLRQNRLNRAAEHLDSALSILQGPVDLRAADPNPAAMAGDDDAAELTWALNTLNNLAIVRRRQGAVDLAERYWNNYLALEGHTDRALGAAQARQNLGHLMLRQGRLDKALLLLFEAKEQFDAVGARRWMSEVRIRLSHLYSHLNDRDTAHQLARQAIDLAPEDLEARWRSHQHLAELLHLAGDYPAAVDTLDDALALVENDPDGLKFLLARSQRAHARLMAGQIGPALRAQQAVHAEITGQDDIGAIARVRYRLALALVHSGEPEAAEPLLMQALKVFRDTEDVFYELLSLEALDQVHADNMQVRLRFSNAAFERAQTLRHQPLADARQVGLGATLARIDARHVNLLVAAGRADEAWLAVSRSKAGALLNLIRARQRSRSEAQRSELLDKHADLVSRLHRQRLSGNQTGTRADETATALQLRIDRVETRLRQLLETEPVQPMPPITALQRQLQDGQLLLDYYLLPDRLLLWAVSASDRQLLELADPSGIEQQARELLGRVSHPRQALGAIDRLAGSLGNRLLEPVATALEQADQVLIRPHGVLHALPFAVLPLGDGILIDQASVRTLLAAESPALRPPDDSSPAQQRLLVLADPGWQRGSPGYGGLPADSLLGRLVRDNLLSRLPGTAREAETLGRLQTADTSVRVLTGIQASRQFLSQGGLRGYPTVHIATHGLVDLRYPSLSALLLADEGSMGPALLRPQEIAELELDARLVVLSGCETGLGPISGGEGALSLARPFLVAGAGEVISTLWKIDDQRTALFMQSFYEHLLAGNHSPAAALAAAQLEMRRDRRTAHPYYWAGFVLSGTTLASG
ncbi:MAG: CHAT domain-containing protein [Pseudomonadota bacterium]|nr:MAG: CHAT domain-containing protein [Pseudomonadota bacterium]